MASREEDVALTTLKGLFGVSSQPHDGFGSNDLTVLEEHIKSRTSLHSQPDIPTDIRDVHRQYLEAVRDNTLARLKYAEAIENARIITRQVTPRQQPASRALLGDHLNLLRQQQLHKKLSILQKYLRETETALSVDHSADSGDNTAAHDFQASRTLQDDSKVLQAHLQALTRKLEIAVLEANSQAKHENASLQAARLVESTTEVDPSNKLRSLIAVRDELTTWLEGSLAACGDGVDEDPADTFDGEAITAENVQAEYDRYVEARRRLLSAVPSGDAIPVPKKTSPSDAQSRPPNAVRLPLDNALQAEQSHLQKQPLKSIKQLQAYASELLDAERSQTLNALLRLADESQLLPQYPLLSRSDKFGKLAAQLGRGSAGNGEDKILNQIESWAFAADAAKTSTESAVAAQTRAAEKALDELEEVFEELKLLSSDSGIK